MACSECEDTGCSYCGGPEADYHTACSPCRICSGLTGTGFTKEEADELYKDRKKLIMTVEERAKYLDWLKAWSQFQK